MIIESFLDYSDFLEMARARMDRIRTSQSYLILTLRCSLTTTAVCLRRSTEAMANVPTRTYTEEMAMCFTNRL